MVSPQVGHAQRSNGDGLPKKYRFSDSHLPQSLYLKETRKKLLKYIQAPFLRDTISPKDSNNLTKTFLL